PAGCVCVVAEDYGLGRRSLGAARPKTPSSRPLPLDDAERDHSRDPGGEAGTLDDPDDALDVLVGEGHLLGQPGAGGAGHDDPLGSQAAPHVGTGDRAPSSGAAQSSSSTV